MALEYYFRFPFAVGGDKTPLADTIQPDGTVSWQQGYSVDYQLDPATNPLAKNIDRLTYNGSLYPITRAIQEYQQTGNPDWITPAQNGGTPFAYPLNAIVRYDDGSGVKLYRNTISGNTAAPNVSGWVDGSGALLSDTLPLVNGGAAAGTATAASRSDHVHPTDNTRAPLASPALTGTPTAPTPPTTDNTTKLATTAFVRAAIPALFQGANQSLATSGYQIFPGGLIIQWGRAFLTANPATVTFPITYPNGCFSFTMEATTNGAAFNTSSAASGVSSVSNSSVVVWGGGNYNHWISTGY